MSPLDFDFHDDDDDFFNSQLISGRFGKLELAAHPLTCSVDRKIPSRLFNSDTSLTMLAADGWQ